MPTYNTYFEQLNSVLTVESICTKLDEGFPPDCWQRESVDAWTNFWGYEPEEPIPLLDSREGIHGFVSASNKCAGASLYETREQLGPEDFVSANMSILDALNLFSGSDNNHFYVLAGNSIVGILLFDNFYGPLGRLAFLALALEIEEQAVNLCQLHALREKCWSAISAERQRSARRLYAKRHGKNLGRTKLANLPLKELIDCTYLSDKATMIWKCKLSSTKTRKSFLGIFHKLERIRNDCAHSKSEGELKALLPHDDLIEFVETVKTLRNDLSLSWAKHFIVLGWK